MTAMKQRILSRRTVVTEHTRLHTGVAADIIYTLQQPVIAADVFAFAVGLRAVNTEVDTFAEEKVRHKLRAEEAIKSLKVKNVLALALVVRRGGAVLKASVKAPAVGE